MPGFVGYVDLRRQQAEGAFQGAEGAQDGGDLGRNGQLEAGSEAEQVGEHLGGGGGPAREVAGHEPAERPLQLLLVDVVRAREQFQQRVAERRRVAAADREQQALQRGPLLGVQAADRAEIKQGEAPVKQQQDVARSAQLWRAWLMIMRAAGLACPIRLSGRRTRWHPPIST
jgi:hypothetical protein